MAMVGAAPASTSTLTRIEVPSAAGDWSITRPTKMLPVSLSVVESSAAAGIAIRRTTEDGSSRLARRPAGRELQPHDRPSFSRNGLRNDCARRNHRSLNEVVRGSLAHQIGKPRGRNSLRQRAAPKRDRCQIALFDRLAAVDGVSCRDDGSLTRDPRVDHVRQQAAEAERDDAERNPLWITPARHPRWLRRDMVTPRQRLLSASATS